MYITSHSHKRSRGQFNWEEEKEDVESLVTKIFGHKNNSLWGQKFSNKQLARTFSYYVKFPESRWDEIKIAEQFTPEGETMHAKLGIEFDDKYRLQKPTMPDFH